MILHKPKRSSEMNTKERREGKSEKRMRERHLRERTFSISNVDFQNLN